MEAVLHALAACRAGLAEFGMAPAGLAVSLFLAGLGGSVVHCAGMCGPFVLGQVVADAETLRGAHYGEWRRLAGAALLPYHLGRLTTYSGLGALAGAATALFAASRSFGWIAAALLVVGAGFMLMQAIGLASGGALSAGSWFGSRLARLATPLSSSQQILARYGLGLVLGFLPCGLVYGALGAAAGTGSAARGAMAMAAFALGTVPALVAVGWGGVIMRRRLREAGRWVFAPLLLANAGLMLVLAGERLVNGG